MVFVAHTEADGFVASEARTLRKLGYPYVSLPHLLKYLRMEWRAHCTFQVVAAKMSTFFVQDLSSTPGNDG